MNYLEKVELSEKLINKIDELIEINNVEMIYKDFEYNEDHHNDFKRLMEDNIVTIIKETVFGQRNNIGRANDVER